MAIVGGTTIKVNTQVLLNKADDADNSINQMKNCFEELEKIINRTSYYWIGEAGDKHRNIYNSQKDTIDEMLKRLKEHPRDLKTIAQQYESVEMAVQEISNELPGDVIV
jgi:WXG100 family type VII secretion target